MTEQLDPVSIIEGALLTAGRPLETREIRLLFENAYSRKEILSFLSELRGRWEGRAVALAEGATGWRFVGRASLTGYLKRISNEKAPRYSRSFMETLAIIAYRQPVTRGDIEEIRGVTLNANSLRQMVERGWVERVGRRDTQGRPSLWGTTAKFLEDFSLKSLDSLPEIAPVSLSLEVGSDAREGAGGQDGGENGGGQFPV